MAIAIASVPSSPVHENTTARIDLTGLDNSTKVYIYVDPVSTGGSSGRSPVFVGAYDGTGLYGFTHIFDAAGSWTIRLRKSADDTDLATQSVTVS